MLVCIGTNKVSYKSPYNDTTIEKANVFTSLSIMDCQGAEAEREL